MKQLEYLMMKREQFPPQLQGFNGNLFDNRLSMIPPFHRSIVEKGIDLETAHSVIDEVVKNTLKDYKGYNMIDNCPEISQSEEGIDLGPVIKDESGVYYPEFPLTSGLHIQRDMISPHGDDHYIMLLKDSRDMRYLVPHEFVFSPEIQKEYGMRQQGKNKHQTIFTCKSGWRGHNIGFRDVFYKNMIIALNNAAVRAKYSETGKQ
jgi:hypothetical protein